MLDYLRIQKGWKETVRFSTGYAPMAPGERCEPAEMIQKADAAMYRHKASAKTLCNPAENA